MTILGWILFAAVFVFFNRTAYRQGIRMGLLQSATKALREARRHPFGSPERDVLRELSDDLARAERLRLKP